jgi:hypothetical protein
MTKSELKKAAKEIIMNELGLLDCSGARDYWFLDNRDLDVDLDELDSEIQKQIDRLIFILN